MLAPLKDMEFVRCHPHGRLSLAYIQNTPLVVKDRHLFVFNPELDDAVRSPNTTNEASRNSAGSDGGGDSVPGISSVLRSFFA
jgi:hypothetical protein